jgi:hypothetical protein
MREAGRDKLPMRNSDCGVRDKSAFGVAAFGRKPPFEISAGVCGALPRRRYVRIYHFNAGSRRATSSALARLLNALMRK